MSTTDRRRVHGAGKVYNVDEFSAGYAYTLALAKSFGVDPGVMLTRYALPAALEPFYGADPASFLIFARFRLL